ncbi:hypothetical protein BJ170DRAFT_700050 [Xylariales sp. AK1849]|nr:hypothetical protein BJ170DRAFT_700050 [Xylariales sp. AK1849]
MSSQSVLSQTGGWDPERFSRNKTAGGGAIPSTSASLPSIIAAFVPSLITAIAFLLVFIVIRKPFRRIYSPRTYIDVIPEKDRTPTSSAARLSWIKESFKLDDKFILEHSSLDGYLFLRFLRTTILLCFVGSCITWLILFPVNATGGGNASQLDKLGFGNVRGQSRLWAHAVVAWVLFGFVMFLVARERIWLIGLRQAWHLSKANASRLSSRTVLYLDPPKHASLDGDAQSTFGQEANQQWIVTATPKLDSLVSSRNSKAMQLESTQVSFLTKVNKKRSKILKKQSSSNTTLSEQTISNLRPLRRKYYLVGEGSDAIHHLRNGLQQATRDVDENRKSFSATQDQSRAAVFVAYSSQSEAQRAYRGDSKSHVPVPPNLSIQSRLIGVRPSEVLWSNLSMPLRVRVSKKLAGNIIIAALIFFWSFISAFVGSISNVNYLSDNFEWLHWIKNLPDPILGLMTGLLPPLITSFLSSYVPIFMRFIAKLSEPTTVSAELLVQAWYYAFQVIQVFFVTALSSSASAFIPAIIAQPHQVPLILAENLPKSSNFYLTYFILQGLGTSSKNILNISDLFEYYFFDMFINKTPRQKYSQFTSLKGISWGKVYPKFTNFVIIALAYSCISPLVLGLAGMGLALFYLSYRHNLLLVMQPKLETNGRCYTRSLSQILSGVYVGELCLIGLLGLRKATGPAIATTILFFCTIVYNVVLNRHLNPLEDHLPDELLAEGGEEEASLLAAEEGEALEAAHDRSHVQRLGHNINMPRSILDPVAKFFEPHLYASHKTMKAFLRSSELETPAYDEGEVRTAYTNPSLVSNPPQIWLPSDEAGLSREEIEENSAAGISTTDDGAWLDENGKVKFNENDLRSLPAWKKPVAY